MTNTTTQAYAIMNQLQKAALGKDATIQVVDSTTFVCVANKLLSLGYDRLTGVIDTVLAKTLFDNRKYNAKFKVVYTDAMRFGNYIRKISVVDPEFEAGACWDTDNNRFINDGESVDQYKVKKPNVVVTRFLGNYTFKLQEYTKFGQVLDVAFSSESELVAFWNMLAQNAMNIIEQVHENVGRAIVATFIAQKISADSGNVIHLITEYNTALGLPRGTAGQAGYVPAYTATTIMDVYPEFVAWAMARIENLSDLMTERSIKYHINFTNKPIARWTDKKDQIVLFNSQFLTQVEKMVHSGAYHDELLKIANVEKVAFWQDINAPMDIKIKIEPLQADGTLGNAATVTASNILGVIADPKAMAYTTCSSKRLTTPVNASGDYQNTFDHFIERVCIDPTENGIVFCLD